MQSSRGYLWEALPDEIVEEFARLSQMNAGDFMDLGEIPLAGFYIGRPATSKAYLRNIWLDEDRALPPELLARLRERRWAIVVEYRRLRATGMNVVEKQRVLRARRAVEGRCVECERKREPGNSRCHEHRQKLIEYSQARRAAAAIARKRAMRERLPDVREGLTHHFVVTAKKIDGVTGEPELVDIDGYIQTGLYPDGRVGEIFLKIGKAGDQFAAFDQWAIDFSLLLQHGVPLEELCKKHEHTQFWPFGATSNREIPRCSSIPDYVARWLLLKYGKEEQS